MSLAPEKIAELKQIIHTHLSQVCKTSKSYVEMFQKPGLFYSFLSKFLFFHQWIFRVHDFDQGRNMPQMEININIVETLDFLP